MRFSILSLALASSVSASITHPEHIHRRADHEWDHILKGADIANFILPRDTEPIAPDYIANYNLRSRKVDPLSLGVDSVKQISGYLDDLKNDKHLFYWFFESRNDPVNDPVVLWLNGGPGCSSLIGLFTELGPASIPNKDLKPVRNPYAWNNNASVIFIDQPVNTGFSYSSKEVHDSHAAAQDLSSLLSLFFTQFPQYSKQDFHIAGESYAGHYIPSTGHEILTNNHTNINLKSLLIGNGLTDPLTQYKYYRPMACGEGGKPAVNTPEQCAAMEAAAQTCLPLIETCYLTNIKADCVAATLECNQLIFSVYRQGGKSVYDVRQKDGDDVPNYVADFLNQDSTKQALGVEVSRKWEMCNLNLNLAFVENGDWMQPIHRFVTTIMQKIPVLIYAGDADFICNWLGNQAWTNALEWPGKAAFAAAKIAGVNVDGKEYGQVKHADKLTFLRVYEAGHFVPQNQPVAALNFFARWLSGEWRS